MERDAFKELEEAMIGASYPRKDRAKIMREMGDNAANTERESNIESV